MDLSCKIYAKQMRLGCNKYYLRNTSGALKTSVLQHCAVTKLFGFLPLAVMAMVEVVVVVLVVVQMLR